MQVDIEIQMVGELDIETEDIWKDTSAVKHIIITNIALRGRRMIADCH